MENNINDKKNQIVRTRIAPSPTGYMHIGTLRTALYAYLIAKQNNGQFILRIEDTDEKRHVEGATEAIYNGLKWAGLIYDEGPDINGQFGPYIQSQRLDLYKKYAEDLIKNNKAYYCFCDEKTLEEMRAQQTAKKQAVKYDRRCLCLSGEETDKKLKNNEPHTIRMKMPENRVIEFNDLVRNEVSFNTNELDDQILLKSDGYPTYHLAVVIDDYLMKISHVTRTEEWLPSTPKHILLYEYFGWEIPQFAHLPLLLNPDKTKMSKRKGDVAVADYIKKGYLPEAMINYLAFLGWNPGTEKEIYSMDELIKDFSLKKVHKAGAIFNPEKLNWLNAHYIKQKNIEELTKLCVPHLIQNNLIEPIWGQEQIVAGVMQPFEILKYEVIGTGESIDFNYLKKIVKLEQERMKNLSEIGELTKFFFQEPEYSAELLKWKNMANQETKDSLDKSYNLLSKIKEPDFTQEKLEALLMPEAEKEGDRGRLLWPLRASITGLKASPGPFEVLAVLGKEKALKRIKKALNLV